MKKTVTKVKLPPITGDPKELKFKFVPMPSILFTDERFAWMTNNERTLYCVLLNESKLSYSKKHVDSSNRSCVKMSNRELAFKCSFEQTTIKTAKSRLEEAGLITTIPGTEKTNNICTIFVNNIFAIPDQELHIKKKEKTEAVIFEKNEKEETVPLDKTVQPKTVPDEKQQAPESETKSTTDIFCTPGDQKTSSSNSKTPSGNNSLFLSLLRVREDTAKKMEVIEKWFTHEKKLNFSAEDRLYCQNLVKDKFSTGDIRLLCHVLTNVYFRLSFKTDMEECLFWIDKKQLGSISAYMADAIKNKRQNTIRKIQKDVERDQKDLNETEREVLIKTKLERTTVDYIYRTKALLDSMFYETKTEEGLNRIVRSLEFLTIQQPDLFWYLDINLQNAVVSRLNDLTKTLIKNCEFNTKSAFRIIENYDDEFAKICLTVKRKYKKCGLKEEPTIREWANRKISAALVKYAFEQMVHVSKEEMFEEVDKKLKLWVSNNIFSVEDAANFEEKRKSTVKQITYKPNRRYQRTSFMENEYTKEHLKLYGIRSSISLFALADGIDEAHFNVLWKAFCDTHQDKINSIDWLNWMEHKAYKMDISDPESIKMFDQEWLEYCEKECRVS